ncbi:apolipoprotein D-like isoform X3 [Paramormyrops kingsleyae]|uniref:apolipoprotein D-like isoform X3 n=1 Tax=Paramormyrops kingsleyae TaxID=1676925 RepID=UPI003B973999
MTKTNKSHQLRRRYDPAPSQSAQASDKIEASGGPNEAVSISRDPSCTEHRHSHSVRMKARFIILLPLLLPLAGGQVYHWGPCPQPEVQPNFELQKYLGRWYEIEKLPSSFERGKCMETNYSMREDGTIKVVNTEQLKGKLKSVEGTAVVQDVNQPAKLGVSFSFLHTGSCPLTMRPQQPCTPASTCCGSSTWNMPGSWAGPALCRKRPSPL